MVNLELVEQTLDWIRAHRNQWDQNLFVIPEYGNDGNVDLCKSTFCFAGTAQFLTNRIKVNDRAHGGYRPLMPDGSDAYSFEDAAMATLGLTEEQAQSIFYCVTSDFDKFEAHVRWVIANPDLGEELIDRKKALNDAEDALEGIIEIEI
jgi:hypothetical protein